MTIGGQNDDFFKQIQQQQQGMGGAQNVGTGNAPEINFGTPGVSGESQVKGSCGKVDNAMDDKDLKNKMPF